MVRQCPNCPVYLPTEWLQVLDAVSLSPAVLFPLWKWSSVCVTAGFPAEQLMLGALSGVNNGCRKPAGVRILSLLGGFLRAFRMYVTVWVILNGELLYSLSGLLSLLSRIVN